MTRLKNKHSSSLASLDGVQVSGTSPGLGVIFTSGVDTQPKQQYNRHTATQQFNTLERTMNFDIEFINEQAPTEIYDADRQLEFEEKHTLTNAEDIGGLMVYTAGGKVTGVYDYENWVGWVV
jgi:hypothetical protein